MGWPALTTYDRVDLGNDPAGRAEGYEKSYFGMRLLIGIIGVALPLLLVVVDQLFLDAPFSVRGSMSAYYHSGARDLFVGGLAACGVTLVSYMFWKWWTWDFLISAVGGIAVLGVAAFPTARERLATDPHVPASCDYHRTGVPDCTPLQQAWGEDTVQHIHLGVTAVVVASFALLCLVFALRDFGYGVGAHALVGDDVAALGPRRIWSRRRPTGILRYTWTKAPRTVLYLACLVGVLVGAAWALVGPDWVVPHGYAGEFVAFTSFGAAWIVASWDLLKRAGPLDTAVTAVGQRLGVAAG